MRSTTRRTRRWGVSLAAAFAVIAGSASAAGAVPGDAPSELVGGSLRALDDGDATVELVVSTQRRFTESTLEAAASADVDIVERIDALDSTIIEVPASQADDIAAALADRSDVSAAYAVSPVSAFATDDPLSNRQRWMQQQGFEVAWQTTTGAASVTVAVLDTGVNETADLAGRVLDGIDYVNGGIARGRDDDPDTHGTIAATLIGAAGNDGFGIAGACWQCRILPVKVLDAAGNGDTRNVAKGIVYAADSGASIINLSLGGPGADPIVAEAVSYAEARGAIVVAAAGNDYESAGAAARYPAAFPNVIGVGSYVSDSIGTAAFSQRGPQWYEVAAGACYLDGLGPDDACGTSFSAPYVSGALALMRSARPDLPAAQHKSSLFSSSFAYSARLAADFRHGRIAVAAAMQDLMRVPVPDTTPPTVSISAPTGIHNAQATLNLEVHANDNVGMRSVWLLVGTANVHSWYQTSVNGIHPLSADLIAGVFGDGQYTLRLIATDTSGNVSEATATVTIDTKGPVAAVFRPGNNTTVRRHLDIVAYSADPSGTVATFVIVNQKVVSGWLGDGAHSARVPITRNGRLHIVTLTIDRANNISASNHVFVNGRRR